MTERLTAPARSPLRRTVGNASPLRTKQSKSPIRRVEAKNKLQANGHTDTEADLLRHQAEAADVDHEIAHLSPSLQRFWQVWIVQKDLINARLFFTSACLRSAEIQGRWIVSSFYAA